VSPRGGGLLGSFNVARTALGLPKTDAEEVRTYYDRPVLKAPVWKWPIPTYFFAGGLAGASASLALGARVSGDDALARRALGIAVAGALVSPPLLIADLGRPTRFLNMLRVAKPTSPMSVGTWVVSVFVPAVAGAALCDLTGCFAGVGRVLERVAGALGPVMCTYTAVLLADTAVPAWHEARRELPFVFAGSAMASAGAAVVALSPVAQAGAARRLLIAGVVMEGAASQIMERRHVDACAPYRGAGRASSLARAARVLTVAGTAVTLTLGRRGRSGAAAGAAVVLAGALFERLCVSEAGVESARDPRTTVALQNRRDRSGAAGQVADPEHPLRTF